MGLVFCGVCAQSAPLDTFEDKVRPILPAQCFSCHNEKTRSSGLSMATESDLLAGGARLGATVQPGRPEESALIKVLRGQLEPRMPLGKPPLAEDQIAVIASWIENLEPGPVSSAPRPADWWAFQPVRRLDP